VNLILTTFMMREDQSLGAYSPMRKHDRKNKQKLQKGIQHGNNLQAIELSLPTLIHHTESIVCNKL